MTALTQTQVPDKEIDKSVPYVPLPQFKLIDTPLIQDISLENTELWLVRIQDGQLRPDELKEKRVELTLTTTDERLGSFENSKGTQFEILNLESVGGIQPYAFLPESNGAFLDVHKVARQVAIVRSFDPIVFRDPIQNDDSNIPDAANGGRRARIKLEESQAGSASIGGFSTVESLQENEEKISTENIVKSARKKSKPEQKDSEVENEGRTSKEKATKCKKSENSQDMEERISTEVSLKSAKKKLKGEKSTAEGVLSPLTPSHKDLQVHVSENEETTLKENVTKSGKKSKREHSTSEPELSSPKPMQPELMSSEKKSRKHKKSKTEGSHQ